MPPNQSQISPVRGGEAPPPLPQEAKSHNGVPKLVEVSGSQVELGMPPFSKLPSTITSLLQGVVVGVGVGVVGVAVGVGVGVGQAAPGPKICIVLIGTPIDLGRLLKINKPSMRVTYELEEREPGQLAAAIKKVV